MSQSAAPHPAAAFDLAQIGTTLMQDVQGWYANTDLAALLVSVASAVLMFVVVYFGLSLALRKTASRLEKIGARETEGRAYVVRARNAATLAGHVIARTSALFIFITALHSAGYALPMPLALRNFSHSIFVIAFVIQTAMWATTLAMQWLEGYTARRNGDRRGVSGATTVIGIIVRTALWSLAAMLILDNLGFNITALVAGLGVGGIAIGLAAQNILSDLFASLSIVLDKPFEIGDFITSGDYMGTVERIGLKTTRLRSLSGEQVVISNTDLLTSRVRNYKRMAERRVVFTIGLAYGTPADKLEGIPGIIRETIEAQQKLRFDRSNLTALGDFSLTFETVYYVLSSDYNVFANTHEKILLTLYKRFELEQIGLVFQTRSVSLDYFPKKAPAAAAPEDHPSKDQ